MISRAVVLAEIDRRLERAGERYALEQFRDWLQSLPPPAEVSGLVACAREMASTLDTTPHSLMAMDPRLIGPIELLKDLATALESADSRLAAEREKVRESEDRIRTLERLVSDITTTFNERMAKAREALKALDGKS